MRNLIKVATISMFLVTGISTTAYSQSIDDSWPRMGMMGGECPMMGAMGHGRMRHGMMRGRGIGHRRMGAMMEARIAFLKAELDISKEQQEVWKGYAEAVRDRVSVMKAMRETMMETMREGTAIERMEARISGMEAMVAAMKTVKPATEKLYAVLTPEQKKTADDLIGVDCGAM